MAPDFLGVEADKNPAELLVNNNNLAELDMDSNNLAEAGEGNYNMPEGNSNQAPSSSLRDRR